MDQKTSSKRDPEATREALLDAAERLFLEKGFGNTSLSQIGRSAGITKSLIHHYFGSKEGLWREVKQRRFLQYAEKQMAMIQAADPTVDLLKESFILYFHFIKDNPQMVRILAWMFLEQDMDECVNVDRELVQAGVDKIKAAQEKGHFRKDIDPRFILFTFLGLVQHWFQDREHFINDFGTDALPDDLDQAYLQDVLKIFFEGILPQS